MSEPKSHDKKHDFEGSNKRPRTRVRETDLMRVEGTVPGVILYPFELEVREKLAIAKSPFEELVQKEDESSNREKQRSIHAKLTRLSKKAPFTARQRAFFELFYVEYVSDKEISERFSVSRSTVRRFRQKILQILKKYLLRKENIRRMLKLAPSIRLTAIQRRIFKLRYKQGLPVAEIARNLGKQPTAIYAVLERIRKKFPQGSMERP